MKAEQKPKIIIRENPRILREINLKWSEIRCEQINYNVFEEKNPINFLMWHKQNSLENTGLYCINLF